MNQLVLERNILLYYFFQALKNPLFCMPVLISCVKEFSGMDMSQIYTMDALILLLVVGGLEIFSGTLADLVGRRPMLLAGSILMTAAFSLLATAHSALTVWIVCIMMRLSVILFSGSDSALLYDTLKHLGRENDYIKVEGRSFAIRTTVEVVCYCAAGYLAAYSLRLTVILSAFFLLFSCVTAWLLTDPPVAAVKRNNLRDHVNLMKLSATVVLKNKQILWIILISALFASVTGIWYVTSNPYFEVAKLPVKYYGWIFALLGVVVGLCGTYSQLIRDKIGEQASFILPLVIITASMLAMGSWVTQISCLLIITKGIVDGYVVTVLESMLQNRIDSGSRATIISINNMISCTLRFILMIIFCSLVKICSLPECLTVLGCFMLVCGIALVVMYRKTFALSKEVKAVSF